MFFISVINMFLPLKVENIPLLPEIKENWLFNYFSSGYMILVRFSFFSVI